VHARPIPGPGLFFSGRSSPERDALLLVADKHITRSILTTIPLEDHNRVTYNKPDFMFRDTIPDTDQQLLARKGQWIFTIEDEKYYIPLSFFQSVTTARKMKWAVT